MFCPTLIVYPYSPVSDTLVINEIYLSLQGESTFAGLPCIFVRLTACNLRCSYCDTAYAFTEGRKDDVLPEITARVEELLIPGLCQNVRATCACPWSNSPAANRFYRRIPCR